MADLYLTLKATYGSEKMSEREYVDLANAMLRQFKSDPVFTAILKDRSVSVQIRGFDPVVLSGSTHTLDWANPINPQRELGDLATKFGLEISTK